jgi:Type I restriction enzyme HindI endonuclease subunit-like, C-terminal
MSVLQLFRGALGTNDSAVAVLGDDILRTIARDLAETVKMNASIDWEQKESVRAGMRVAVKRILRKYGYPPDKQEQATALVIEQAEQLGLDLQATQRQESDGMVVDQFEVFHGPFLAKLLRRPIDQAISPLTSTIALTPASRAQR